MVLGRFASWRKFLMRPSCDRAQCGKSNDVWCIASCSFMLATLGVFWCPMNNIEFSKSLRGQAAYLRNANMLPGLSGHCLWATTDCRTDCRCA